jgi:transposase InsO family protein
MERDAAKYSRVELCQALGVSRSGWYHHQAKANSTRRVEDQMLAEKIISIFNESRRTYGWRRIAQMLARERIRCGKERILRLMKRQGLRPIQKRRHRPRTTQSRHDQPIAINRLKGPEQLSGKPNEVWCGDITYIPTLEDGWVYLAGQLDLNTKRLTGWKLGDSLESDLVIEAFRRATKLWQIAPQIHHSDRGVQYASSDFRRLLESHGVSASMSAKGNCYDNAAMESFWATLKTECFHNQIPRNREHAQALLFDYIETFYNPKRLHSSLGYQSPFEFEQAYWREQTQAA